LRQHGSGEAESDSGDKFRRVRLAYEILTDPDARARHDSGQFVVGDSINTVLEVDLGVPSALCVLMHRIIYCLALSPTRGVCSNA